MLKLNKKRTFYLGFAFFTILMLWQVYNYYCPMFLEELLKSTYGAGDYNYLIGIIMALDNILALKQYYVKFNKRKKDGNTAVHVKYFTS